MIASPQRTLRRLVGAALGGRTRVVRVLSGAARGARLELDLRSDKDYWLGVHERDLQELLREHVKPGSVVYDIGAHYGFVSVCAARLGARVYAFEPAPGNAHRIRRNAELNALPIEVVEAAVWETDAPVRLVTRGLSDRQFRAWPGGDVPAVSIDTFASTHPPPDFVKIDAEGAEADVLRGAANVLADARPIVVYELHVAEEEEDIRALLSSYRIEATAKRAHFIALPS